MAFAARPPLKPNYSPEQLRAQIELLDDDIDAEPNQLVIEAAELQHLAQSQNLFSIAASAAARQGRLLVQLERFEEAERVIAPYINRGDVDVVSQSYLLASQLYISAHYRDSISFAELSTKARLLMPMLVQAGHEVVKGELLLEISHDLIYFEKFEQALEPVKEAMAIFKRHDELRASNNALAALANIYNRLGHHQLAVDTYLQVLANSEQISTDIDVSITLFNIGSAYASIPDYHSSQRYLLRSRDLSEQIGDQAGVGYADMQLGKQHLKLGQHEAALAYLDSALVMLAPTVDDPNYLTIQGQRVRALFGLQHNVEAEQVLAELSASDLASQSEQYQISFNDLLHEVHLHRGEYQQALETYKKVAEKRLEVADRARESTMAQMLAEFGAEQAIVENRLLEQDSKLKQAQLEQSEHQRVFLLLLILGGAMLFASLVFIWFREKKARKQIEQVAMQDFLTSAPNRRAVIGYARKSMSQCVRSDQPFSVAIIDLDNFKRLNDSYGHDVGDKVLKLFATICEQELREGDQYGRIGGEEWLLVFPTTEATELVQVFERLRKRMQSARITEIDPPCELTFSMGVAQADSSTERLDDLIKAADANVYQAKRQGRDRVVITAIEAKTPLKAV